MEDGIKHFLEKRIVVIFNDGSRISRKEGILKNIDSNFLYIDTGTTEGISIDQIIRWEVM
jgi:hypothetical protein